MAADGELSGVLDGNGGRVSFSDLVLKGNTNTKYTLVIVCTLPSLPSQLTLPTPTLEVEVGACVPGSSLSADRVCEKCREDTCVHACSWVCGRRASLVADAHLVCLCSRGLSCVQVRLGWTCLPSVPDRWQLLPTWPNPGETLQGPMLLLQKHYLSQQKEHEEPGENWRDHPAVEERHLV